MNSLKSKLETDVHINIWPDIMYRLCLEIELVPPLWRSVATHIDHRLWQCRPIMGDLYSKIVRNEIV